MRNSTAFAGRTPRNRSLAYMNGRRYRLESSPEGTQSRSAFTRAAMAPRKSSSDNGGSASRWADRANRAALACGRNVHTVPSACRYAFIPSKISCA